MMPCPDPVVTAAAERPDALAVADVDRDERLTYEALDRAVDRAAAGLSDRGVVPGDRVAIATGMGSPAAVSVHAVRRVGAIAAPIDPERTGEDGADHLVRIDPALLIAGEAAEPDLELAPSVPYDALLDRSSSAESVTPSRWDPDAPACLLSTSGTTGRSRIVTLSWRNLVASAMASAARLGVLPSDRWLTPLDPHHMGGLAPVVRCAVYGTAYVAHPFDTETIAETIDKQPIAGVSLVPVMLRRLIEADAPLDDLRFVLVGGDRTPPALVRQALDRDVPLYTTYGMTETASQIATATPAELRETPETVGRPLRWVDVTIAAGEADAAGEIVVDGPAVAEGYWRDPDATAERFGPDGFHTRDEGHIDDSGRLFVRGRLDERIVSGGVTVDPARVAEMLEAQPGVRAAAVVGLPDEEWGERVGALVAADELDAATIDTERIRESLGAAAVPRELAVAETLPRTVSGTVDRKAVRERLGGERE